MREEYSRVSIEVGESMGGGFINVLQWGKGTVGEIRIGTDLALAISNTIRPLELHDNNLEHRLDWIPTEIYLDFVSAAHDFLEAANAKHRETRSTIYLKITGRARTARRFCH